MRHYDAKNPWLIGLPLKLNGSEKPGRYGNSEARPKVCAFARCSHFPTEREPDFGGRKRDAGGRLSRRRTEKRVDSESAELS